MTANLSSRNFNVAIFFSACRFGSGFQWIGRQQGLVHQQQQQQQPLLPVAWAQVSTFHMLQSSEAEAWGLGYRIYPSPNLTMAMLMRTWLLNMFTMGFRGYPIGLHFVEISQIIIYQATAWPNCCLIEEVMRYSPDDSVGNVPGQVSGMYTSFFTDSEPSLDGQAPQWLSKECAPGRYRSGTACCLHKTLGLDALLRSWTAIEIRGPSHTYHRVHTRPQVTGIKPIFPPSD